MRDVAVVSYASSAVARDDEHNETEIIVPVVREALAQSGLQKSEIGFVCSGSLDYLQGGPFAFVTGLDAYGAWPPIRESHVEMDGAWALYEAWVAIQTGEVDAALVYGFGKSSPGDLHEIMALVSDDVVFETTGPAPDGERHQGADSVRAVWDVMFAVTNDPAFHTEASFVCGDRGVLQWIYSWSTDSGEPAHIRGVDLLRFAGGKVVEKVSYVKG